MQRAPLVHHQREERPPLSCPAASMALERKTVAVSMVVGSLCWCQGPPRTQGTPQARQATRSSPVVDPRRLSPQKSRSCRSGVPRSSLVESGASGFQVSFFFFFFLFFFSLISFSSSQPTFNLLPTNPCSHPFHGGPHGGLHRPLCGRRQCAAGELSRLFPLFTFFLFIFTLRTNTAHQAHVSGAQLVADSGATRTSSQVWIPAAAAASPSCLPILCFFSLSFLRLVSSTGACAVFSSTGAHLLGHLWRFVGAIFIFWSFSSFSCFLSTHLLVLLAHFQQSTSRSTRPLRTCWRWQTASKKTFSTLFFLLQFKHAVLLSLSYACLHALRSIDQGHF